MMSPTKTVEFTLDRRIDSVLLKIGYAVDRSDVDGAPLTVRIIWINPANIRSTLTDEEWETIHAFIYSKEALYLEADKRSTLDPYL